MKNHKDAGMTPADQYLQRAFELSLDDEVVETDKMLRALWMTLLQESIHDGNEERIVKWKRQVKRIENHPSRKFPINIYDLCDVWEAAKGKDGVRFKTKISDMGELHKPIEIQRELRKAMDRLSVICGEVSVATGIKVTIPPRITAKGVGSNAR